MPQNFLACDRNQPLLLPPDLRDWLPEDHLAWFVIEAVEQLDLEPFYAAYRADGHGRAAHEPRMMVALLAYAYAIGECSARAIERRCREDIAFRVLTAKQVPDHATIARFRVRHERGARRSLRPGARPLRRRRPRRGGAARGRRDPARGRGLKPRSGARRLPRPANALIRNARRRRGIDGHMSNETANTIHGGLHEQ
jgi:transposase